MHLSTVCRILGILLMVFSLAMIPPIVVSVIYADHQLMPFLHAFIITLGVGTLIWLPVRNIKKELRVRDGFVVTVLFWLVLSISGSIPLFLSDAIDLSYVDAYFESLSGLTTTGATVITGLDSLPKSILWYRQQLQWFGGMGLIVLAVAILPMLGIGGMQLYRAETPGPVKDSKLTPRITETAKALWYIYLGLTLACALAYWGAGMSLFDAICHAFSTIAIGGFSNYDASIGHFNSMGVNIVCVIFLWIAALNFALHYAAASGRSLKGYFYDPELKAFFIIQISLVLICFIVLIQFNWFADAGIAFDQALIQSVSMSTTAGFTTTDFSNWPVFLPIMLIFSSFIGGCAGSTGGGLKVIRVLLLYLQGKREVDRLIHPKAVYSVKLGDRALPDRVVEAVWGFFSAYAMIFVIIMIGLIATGMDDVTAFSATAATLNNLGPGLGEVAATYADVSDSGKWLLIIAMLFGRLEVFSLLVLFSPTFWRS